MNIQPINSSINFSSTYPVVHWVAETNGSFAPVANLKITKKLQGKVVRVLNKALDETKKPMVPAEQKLRAYIGSADVDYRNAFTLNTDKNQPRVRSFYNRIESDIDKKFTPIGYIISGKDIKPFEDNLAKEIGKMKSAAKELFNTVYSPASLAAIESYNRNGLEFVNDKNLRIKDKQGMTYVLHTKFEIIRDKYGKIKDYRFIDARFMPEYGKGSPFEKISR